MDTIRVLTTRNMFLNGRATPAGTETEVSPAVALDVVNTGRGTLADPQDVHRLRRHAHAQCPTRGLPGGY